MEAVIIIFTFIIIMALWAVLGDEYPTVMPDKENDHGNNEIQTARHK